MGQLLGGPIDLEALRYAAAAPATSGEHSSSGQRERVAQLESTVRALQDQTAELRRDFDAFRSQFG